MDRVLDEIRFLVRSSNRPELLGAVHDDGPVDRGDLENHLDASRRTVARTVEAMLDRGYLRREPAGLEVTAYGAFLRECYDALEADATVATDYAPFLRHVSDDALGFDVGRLAGTELYVATEASPFALVDRTLELRSRTDSFRELAPGVQKQSIEQLADRVEAGEDLDVEILLTADAARAAATHTEYSTAHRIIGESPDVDVHVYDGEFPLFVGVFDDVVALTVTRDGTPYAMVETADQTIHEWAARTCDTYREAAVPIEVWSQRVAGDD